MVSSDLHDLREHLANSETMLAAATRSLATLPQTATNAVRNRATALITNATHDEALDAVNAVNFQVSISYVQRTL